MSVHVSLQPAVTASTESAKGTAPVIAGASFSHALELATESAIPQVTNRQPARDSDKKQPKKADDLKEASLGTLPATAAVAAPPTPVVPRPVSPLRLSPNEAEDQPVISQADDHGNTIAPNSLKSDETIAVDLPLSGDAIAPNSFKSDGTTAGVSVPMSSDTIAPNPVMSDTTSAGVTPSKSGDRILKSYVTPDETTGGVASPKSGNTIAPNSLQSDGTTTGVTLPTSAEIIVPDSATSDGTTLRPASPLFADALTINMPVDQTTQVAGGTGASVTGIDGIAPGGLAPNDGSSSGVVQTEPDDAIRQVLKSNPSSLLSDVPATAAAPSPDVSSDNGVDGTKQQQKAAVPSDLVQAATPVPSSPTQIVTPVPTVPVTQPMGSDVNAGTSSTGVPAPGSNGKASHLQIATAKAKDRAIPDGRVQSKSTDGKDETEADTPSASFAPMVLQTPTQSSHQGTPGQADDKNMQILQAMQPGPAQASSQTQNAGQATTTAQTPSHVTSGTQPSAPSGAVDAIFPTGISGARLIQSVHQSEMKLGMNSAEFGNISISTSVTHQVLSAQISLDHAELGRALAAHLPAMEQKLGDAYGLQTKVEVRDGGSSSSQDSSRQSEEGQSHRPTAWARSPLSSSALHPSIMRATSTLADESSRLDIRI